MRSLLLIGGVLAVVWTAAAQQPIRFTHRVGILNLTNCLAEPGAVPVPLQERDLNLEIVDWTTEAKGQPFEGQFTLELKDAILLGSVLVYGADAVEYRALNQWKRIQTGPEKGRHLQLLPIPQGDLAEALRLRVAATPRRTNDQTQYRATLPLVTLIPLRLLNVALDATVTCSSVSPGGAPPSVLVDGQVAAERNFTTAPRETETSEASPEWVLLKWKEPQSVRGLALWRGSQEVGFGQSVAEVFKGTGDPMAAWDKPEAWEKMSGRVTLPARFRAHQLFVSASSVETRALRIRSLGGVKQLSLGELMVLSDLGYAPSPITATPVEAPKPETESGEKPGAAAK